MGWACRRRNGVNQICPNSLTTLVVEKGLRILGPQTVAPWSSNIGATGQIQTCAKTKEESGEI